jgi:BMFP domain-containing protein YqiC
MKLNQQLAAANEKFDALVERIRTLEANEFKNKAMLDVLVIYGHFFTAITTELEPKLSEIVFRLNALDECTEEFDEQLDAIPRTRQPIGQAQLNIALQTLCTELTTAINESTQVARTAAITVKCQ